MSDDERRRQEARRMTAEYEAERAAGKTSWAARPTEESQKRANRSAAVIVGGAAVLVGALAVFAAMSDPTPSDGGRDSPGSASEGEAWGNCKDAVTAYLTNPATADFGLLSTTIDDVPGGGWRITGEVKGKNAFGVPSSFLYECQVGPAGSVTSARLQPNP